LAIRSILDAHAPQTLLVEGTRVEIRSARLASPPWPSIPGLDEAHDGPFPAPVQLDCRWPTGRVELIVSASLGPRSGLSRPRLGLRVRVAATGQNLVWSALPLGLGKGQGSERLRVPASFALTERQLARAADEAPRAEARRRALASAIERAGLPLASARAIEAFGLHMPEGEVLPLPSDAFSRLVHLALLKLPFCYAPQSPGLEGQPPFDIDALPEPALPSLGHAPPSGRLVTLTPLPGGVRHYKSTLDTILAFLAPEPATVSAFRRMLAERFEAPGKAQADAYLRLFESMRLVHIEGERITLAQAGRALLDDPDPELVFDELVRAFSGVLETLVLVDVAAPLGTERAKQWLEKLLGKRWKTPDQAHFRRNWLLSLGLVDRAAEGDILTPLGRQALARHHTAVQGIYRRLDEIFDEEFEMLALEVEGFEPLDEEPMPESEAPCESTARAPSAAGDEKNTENKNEIASPPGWWADRVDLPAERVRPLTEGLELPRGVLERASAALTAGKHIIFAGPPGTGKTELALAYGEAARREGYCRGVFVATGSADWTSFEIMGGYAMGKDGALHFRPGVFLSAIEGWQWLVCDELNRADVDRAFGELLTILAGRGATMPFLLDDGRPVSVGPDERCTHRVPPSFRLLATMNTWDKTSLFRLSYAVERRFALIHVAVPDDEAYARLLTRAASWPRPEPALAPEMVARLVDLFREKGLLFHRPIGPAIALDMIRYLRARGGQIEHLAEAMGMLLLPQLEGLDDETARAALSVLEASLEGSPTARHELFMRARETFPNLAL